MSLLNRLRNLWNRDRLDRDVNDELRSHIEMRTASNLASGMPSEDAARRARLRFGNAAAVQEATREADLFSRLESLISDLRYGVRVLRRSPGYCAIVIATIALGIGVNTTVFSIVNAFLFQPMAARDPQQIVAVFSSVNRDAPYGSSSYMDYLDIKSRSSDALQDLAAYTIEPVDLSMGNRSIHITAGVVSGNYFQLLGANALLGRVFLPEEDRLHDPRAVTV